MSPTSRFITALAGLGLIVFGLTAGVGVFAEELTGSPLRNLIPTKNFIEDTFITDIGGQVSGVVIGVVGAAMFLVVAYGGIQWLFANGDADKIASARQIIVWAVIGGLAVFAAYGLVSFIINLISAAASTPAVK